MLLLSRILLWEQDSAGLDWNNEEQYGMVRNGTEQFFTKQVHTGGVCTKPGANVVRYRCVFVEIMLIVLAILLCFTNISFSPFLGNENPPEGT